MGNKKLYYVIITMALIITLVIASTQVLLTLPKYGVIINHSLRMEQELIGI